MADRMQWEKFWYRDFMDDVRMCSPGARGVWISILSELWGNGRSGDLVADFSDFGRISGCQDSDEQIENYIGELWAKGVIDLIDPATNSEMTDETYKDKRKYNGLITVRCRRLKKEERDKENNRMRQERFNQKRNNNGQITVQKKEDRRKKIEEERKEIKAPLPPKPVDNWEGPGDDDNGKDAFEDPGKGNDQGKDQDAPFEDFDPGKEAEEQAPMNDKEKRELGMLCSRIQEHYGSIFRPLLWIQNNIRLNWKTHLLVMQRIAEYLPELPKAYADKVASIEEGNFNEREHSGKANEMKGIFQSILEAAKQFDSRRKAKER